MSYRKSFSHPIPNTKVMRHMTELAIDTPQVIAHRLERLAEAEVPLSARDQKEFRRMGSEKVAAFSESWLRMAMEIGKIQQQWMWRWASSWPTMFLGWGKNANAFSQLASPTQMVQAGTDIFKAGLLPVHRTAHANAKRLGQLTF
jgi:hypothetical protein